MFSCTNEITQNSCAGPPEVRTEQAHSSVMSLSSSMMSAGTALPGLGVWADLARELSRSTSCCVLMGSVMLQLGNIPSLSPADPAASPGWLSVSPPPSGELHLPNKRLVWVGGRQAGVCVFVPVYACIIHVCVCGDVAILHRLLHAHLLLYHLGCSRVQTKLVNANWEVSPGTPVSYIGPKK